MGQLRRGSPVRNEDPFALLSGAEGREATETAIKLTRQYWVDAGRPGKYKIISKRASYHGATLGALSLSGFAARRGPYIPLLLPFPQIPEVHCRRCPFGLVYGR